MNFWKNRLRAQQERAKQVKAVKTAFTVGNDVSVSYNQGLIDGMELAIAIYEDREPDLIVAVKSK